jgi:hypothetical protein
MSDPGQNNKNKIINHILTLSIGFQKQYQANNKIHVEQRLKLVKRKNNLGSTNKIHLSQHSSKVQWRSNQ